MGRRDQPELTPSDGELAEAEAATRALLAAHGEPAQAAVPPGLAARIVASLPPTAAPEQPRPWWLTLRPALAYAAVLALALAGLGTLIASGVAGGAVAPESALGQIGLAIAGTALGQLLVGGGAVLGLVALAAGAWLWWYTARRK